MLQIIVGLVLLCLLLALLGKILPFALKLLAVIVALAAGLVIGIPVAAGLAVERLAGRHGRRQALERMSMLAGVLAAAWVAYAGYGWVGGLTAGSMKFLLPALLAWAACAVHQRRVAVERNGLETPAAKNTYYYRLFFCATAIWMFCVIVQAGFPGLVTRVFSSSATLWWFDLGYCVLASLLMLGTMVFEKGYIDVIRGIKTRIAANDSDFNLTEAMAALHKESPQVREEDVQAIVLEAANAACNAGMAELLELRGDIWLFDKKCLDGALRDYQSRLDASLRHDRDEAKALIVDYLPLPPAQAQDYFERYLGFAEPCDFADGQYLVTHLRQEELDRCVSCGLVQAHGGARNDEWFCSPLCEQAEQACVSIREKPLQDFLEESAASGLTLMAAAGVWSQNHRMVAQGGQGHGFAAERGNTLYDKFTGKNSRVVGDDNAKNGPDRLVDGKEIQTKYCSTGARSIGSAFDNKGDGNFRYFGSDGAPMPIEVPRDQYAQAVKTMENKIRAGKVPGVTDPNEASKLVIKGHLTYEQAKNITRFGTFHSITYDVAEGAVVAVSAGGICFAVTATISYLNTGDAKKALQAASVRGGKAFGRALTVYVATQQLHRLATVQAAVKIIDVGSMSKSMAEALQKSMGVNSTNQLNHALRGTVVASLAIVAVSTGPDLLKMVRGRMSGAQFTKNLAVTASTTAGGAVGAIAGGAAGAAFGPAGIWIGKVAGGMIGGTVAGLVSNSLAKRLMQEDSEAMLAIVQRQVEYLCVLFMLTEPEVETLTANLNKAVTPASLELMYASASRKAFANLLIKPMVVGIVKQRPVLRYDVNDVIESFEADIATPAENEDLPRRAAA